MRSAGGALVYAGALPFISSWEDSDQVATDDAFESVVCLIWDKEMAGRTLRQCH